MLQYHVFPYEKMLNDVFCLCKISSLIEVENPKAIDTFINVVLLSKWVTSLSF
jgi:hypothetical protein